MTNYDQADSQEYTDWQTSALDYSTTLMTEAKAAGIVKSQEEIDAEKAAEEERQKEEEAQKKKEEEAKKKAEEEKKKKRTRKKKLLPIPKSLVVMSLLTAILSILPNLIWMDCQRQRYAVL